MTPYDFSRIIAKADAEAVCHAVFDAAHSKWSEQGRSALTEGELTVLCVETFFGENLNGGLWQYLSNESGHLAQFGADALRRVGLPEYAVLLDEAIALCEPTTAESYADEIATTYDSPESGENDEALTALDDRIIDLYFADKAKFRRQLVSYIRCHESQFVYSD